VCGQFYFRDLNGSVLPEKSNSGRRTLSVLLGRMLEDGMELVQERLFRQLCKPWKMVAPGLRITARQPQCVSHNYLKSLHQNAQDRSENPRVGGSIPSLGTIKLVVRKRG
jgi:hypothetical protein